MAADVSFVDSFNIPSALVLGDLKDSSGGDFTCAFNDASGRPSLHCNARCCLCVYHCFVLYLERLREFLQEKPNEVC